MVDYFGQRDRPFETFVSVTVIFILQNFIEERVQNDDFNRLCYDVSYPFISFRTTFVALSLMRQNKNRLTFYSIMIGLLGPCLMKLYERMQCQKAEGSVFSNFIYRLASKNIHRKALVVLLFFIWIVPNLRYLNIWSIYYTISWIPVLIFGVVIFFYLDMMFISLRLDVKLEIVKITFIGILSILIYFMLPFRN